MAALERHIYSLARQVQSTTSELHQIVHSRHVRWAHCGQRQCGVSRTVINRAAESMETGSQELRDMIEYESSRRMHYCGDTKFKIIKKVYKRH